MDAGFRPASVLGLVLAGDCDTLFRRSAETTNAIPLKAIRQASDCSTAAQLQPTIAVMMQIAPTNTPPNIHVNRVDLRPTAQPTAATTIKINITYAPPTPSQSRFFLNYANSQTEANL